MSSLPPVKKSFGSVLQGKINPYLKTSVILLVPHFESFAYGPEPGHVFLVQTLGNKLVTLVNALPGKTGSGATEAVALPPSMARVAGTDALNYMIENRKSRHDPLAGTSRKNLLDESTPVKATLKYASSGTILESFQKFNRGHDIRSVSFSGLPHIQLPHNELELLGKYALTGTSASHNCISAVLSAFTVPFNERSVARVPFLPDPAHYRMVYMHEVMIGFMNLACYMGVSPELHAHRNEGLATTWRSVDANRMVDDSMLEKARGLPEPDKQQLWQQKSLEIFRALSLPELAGHELTESHKTGNPQPLIAPVP